MKRALSCLVLILVLGAAWGQDVSVRANIFVPTLNSAGVYGVGKGLGADIAWSLPASFKVLAAVDTDTSTFAGQTYFLTLLQPGVSYDAFFGPTAFMSFDVGGGWTLAQQPNLALIDQRYCTSAGTSITFFLGSNINVRTAVHYVEIFGLMHVITGSVGFEATN